jgi:hypothetical protein
VEPVDEAVVLRRAGLVLAGAVVRDWRRSWEPTAIAWCVSPPVSDLQDKYAFVHALVPLAAAAALKGDDAWAARIMGAGDAVTERTGATVFIKPALAIKERAEREVRSRLGPDRWARAYAAGRRASIDALLKDIDSIV